MKFELEFGEALAILVAAIAVRVRYEVEGENIGSKAYLDLSRGLVKLESQLWEEDDQKQTI